MQDSSSVHIVALQSADLAVQLENANGSSSKPENLRFGIGWGSGIISP